MIVETGDAGRLEAAPGRRVRVGAARVHALTLAGAVRRVLRRARLGPAGAYVVTPNSHHLIVLEGSEEFRRAYDAAWLVVADSVPLLWASRLLGDPLPGRVNGTDLFEAVCRSGARWGLRVFLLGGRPGTAEGAARVLRARFPGLVIAGTDCPPYGFEHDAAASARVVEAVRAARPQVLFVALGAPKQELWMLENHDRIGVPVSLGVGGSFDFVSGTVPRAPRWMQRAGLEWLFRLVMEPRRLWRRYATTIPRFALLVVRQRVRGR